MSGARKACVVGLAVSLFASTSVAVAQPSSTTTAAPAAAPASPALDPKLEEARQRYARGLQLYNESNFEAARVEFERAYELAPSYKILYNVGLSCEQLGDYVQALRTLERYLREGGADVSDERKAEVTKELAQIRPRIAKVNITTNIPGADLQVDDSPVGRAPKEAVLLNPGRRKISASKEGYLPSSKVITVAGSDQVNVTIELQKMTQQVMVERKRNPFVVPAVIGWTVTAAGGIAAGVTGILASKAKSDQESAVGTFPATRSQLDDAKSKTHSLAVATDAILVGTVVAAGVSTYFTLKAMGWKSGELNVQVGATSAGLSGRF